VRIPRSIRGHELTRAELDSRVEDLQVALLDAVHSEQAMTTIKAFEQAAAPIHGRGIFDLFFGDIALSRRLRVLDAELAIGGLDADVRHDTLKLAADRAVLLRRLSYLQRTKQLFDLWHVLHLPLVYMLLVIVAAHVAITMYMGYVPFRW
jgi:hypothetical protein